MTSQGRSMASCSSVSGRSTRAGADNGPLTATSLTPAVRTVPRRGGPSRGPSDVAWTSSADGSAAAAAGHASLALSLLELIPGGRVGHGPADRVGRRGRLGHGHPGGGATPALGLAQLEGDLVTGPEDGATVHLGSGHVGLRAVLDGDEAEVAIGVEDLDVSGGHGEVTSGELVGRIGERQRMGPGTRGHAGHAAVREARTERSGSDGIA